jgi:Tetratricopeptide repeat/TonB-dependent Receptor Plug Domain
MTSASRGTGPHRGTWRAVAGLAALLVALGARADARQDAKRHYRSGMSLIAAGQLERGIAELKQAYAIKPHADVLYNIARAYVDLGEIREALAYFHRYAATDPKDRAQVEAVMARLSAATKVPIPSEQAAPPVAPAGPAIDPQKLLADIQEMIAHSKAERAPAVSPPAPDKKVVASAKPAGAAKSASPAAPPADDTFEPMPITAQTRATAQEIAAALQPRSDDDIFEDRTPPARADPKAQAMAVIGEDEIRLSGAATIAELLRRIPGLDPTDGEVRSRSSNVLVLVDGRSGYQELLAGTPWPAFDLALPDIARIEVLRGPPLFGARAVVNIVTRGGDSAVPVRGRIDEGAAQGGVAAAGKPVK